MYLATVLVFFVLGGVEALLMRTQLAVPDNTLLTPERYNQILTMHGTTMIFLVVVPVWAGFANYLLPLMIGARDVAFPRLNAWSYWMYLFGGLALYASMLFSPPEAGWFSYVPLSLKQYSRHQRPGGVDLHGPPHRPELDHRRDQLHRHDPQHARARHGLGPHAAVRVDDPDLRVPDHRRADVARRDRDDAAAGPQLRHDVLRSGAGRLGAALAAPVLVLRTPEVYILVLPAFGVFSEILPVFARKPIFGYKAIAAATAGIAFLGMLVWAHHMFATPMSTVVLAFFMLSSFIIAVPTGVKIFNWIATLWRGTVEWTTALLYCVGGIATFTMGGITGIFVAVFPIDWQLTDTYFIVAHFHYTAFGAVGLRDVRGAVLLVPEDVGRMLNERLGKSASCWCSSAST